LAEHGGNVLATRATEQHTRRSRRTAQGGVSSLARAIVLKRDRKKHGKGVIVVVSAGTSDIPVAEEAVVTAELMGNNVQHIYDVESPASTACWPTANLSQGQSDYRLRRHGRRAAQRSGGLVGVQ